MWGTSANCNGIAIDRGEPGEHCDAVPADVRYSDRSRNEGAHMAANDRTDTPALRRLHILSGTVPVSRDDRNAPANEPLTLEGVRDRLLVLHRNLHGHCFALSVMRGTLAGDDTIREVADVLDQIGRASCRERVCT